MAVLYQCAVNITTADGQQNIDMSSLYTVGLELNINQVNNGFRGLNGLEQRGQTYKDQLDQANTWAMRNKMIPKEEYLILQEWFKNETRVNISIVFKAGPLAGVKTRLSDWWLNKAPIQNSIDGSATETTLNFMGYLYDIQG